MKKFTEYLPKQTKIEEPKNNLSLAEKIWEELKSKQKTTILESEKINQPFDDILISEVQNFLEETPTEIVEADQSSMLIRVSKGDKGDVGPQGPPGPPGPKGEKGEKGDKGDIGPRGFVGPKGEQGLQGEVGPQGPQGEKGDRGVTGLKGEVGPQGPQGEKGDRGVQGVPGPKGEIGLQGEQGIQGPQGEKGDRGDPGPQGKIGPPGPKGDKGDPGPQGPKGEQGLRGPRGEKGDKGDAGPQGPKGEKGDPADLKEIYEKFKKLSEDVNKRVTKLTSTGGYGVFSDGGGSGSYFLHDLGDTDYNLKNATNGQILTYDSALGKWTAKDTSGEDVYARNHANAAFNYANTISLSGYATEVYVNSAISNLINSAPVTLDTLKELASALGDDANFSTTVINLIGNAYNQANTGTELAQAAFDYANTIVSDTQIDPYARNHANAAFDKANTGVNVFDQNLNTTNSVSFTTLTVTGNSSVQHVIPSSNVTYDLGSPTNQFRHLYLSGNSIFLGSVTLSTANGVLELPSGTTIGGVSADPTNATDEFSRNQANAAFVAANTAISDSLAFSIALG